MITSLAKESNSAPLGDASSMLAVKAMLIAIRLAQRPAALILDEPDWGLTRTVAIALVLITVEKAHALGIPVIVISHKPWWRSLAASVVQVEKHPASPGIQGFSIGLHFLGRNQ
jgi:ABC-type branched-subunit amino acid transport system ATPase component